MSKIMRSAVALLLVLVCANTNYVAFAVMREISRNHLSEKK